jgi:hypothetical protein
MTRRLAMSHFRALVYILLLCGATLGGQAPAVGTSTTGVLTDVTVVDRAGRPVVDLTPADFEP